MHNCGFILNHILCFSLPSSTNEGQYYAVIMSCLRSSANVDASLHSYARRLILHWRRRQQLLVVRQLLAETRHNFMINQGEGGVERIFFDEV